MAGPSFNNTYFAARCRKSLLLGTHLTNIIFAPNLVSIPKRLQIPNPRDTINDVVIQPIRTAQRLSDKERSFPARRTGRRVRHDRADSWLHLLELLLGGLPRCSHCVQSLKASRDQIDKAEIPRLVLEETRDGACRGDDINRYEDRIASHRRSHRDHGNRYVFPSIFVTFSTNRRIPCPSGLRPTPRDDCGESYAGRGG
jgi:hypothetical protein